MAVLYISEYVDAPIIGSAHVLPFGNEPAVAEQYVGIGGSSTASSAFNVKTRFVRIHTDAICSILFGTAPTAVTTAKRMAANATEYFAVPPGQSYQVAVIANT